MYITLRNYYKKKYTPGDYRKEFIKKNLGKELFLKDLLEIDNIIFEKIMLCSKEENEILNTVLKKLIEQLAGIIQVKSSKIISQEETHKQEKLKQEKLKQ